MIRMSVSGRVFLLVPAYPGCPGPRAIKRLCVCVCVKSTMSGGVLVWLSVWSEVHMVQLMPLSLTVSCFSEIQIGFTFLVSAHLGSTGQSAVKWMCVCMCEIDK